MGMVNDTDNDNEVDELPPLYPKELESIVGPLNVRLSNYHHMILAVYLTLVGIIATICNVIVILVLLKKNTFKKRSVNILLLNIACSDLAISFSGYPLFTASNYAGRWIAGVAGCKIAGFTVYFFSSVTIVTYAYIAYYRYIYVCKPNTRPTLTPRFTGKLLLSIWMFSLLWTAAPLVGWSRYILEPFGTSCSIDWSGRDVGNTMYQVASCILLYFTPLGAILWSYGNVIKCSKGVDPRRVVEHAGRGPPKRNLFFKLINEDAQIDLHVTKMCILMTVVFITAWTPYAVECLWAMHQTEISVIASVMPTMCCKASPMLNPLVLIISSSDFRADFKQICPFLFRPTNRRSTVVLSLRRREESKDVLQPECKEMSSTFYVRECDGLGKQEDAAAVYYNNEKVFIGHIRTEDIEKEAAILKKDHTERQYSNLRIDTGTTKEAITCTSMDKGKRVGGKGKAKRLLPKRVQPEIESRSSSC
ncbi:rhodopsin, G0-coupled-like [Amphiura filiformis]